MSFERRALPDGGHVLISTTLEDAGFLGAFTERDGGTSDGEFASLNLSYSAADRPDRVAENRRRVREGLSLQRWALGGQVHGATIAEVTEERAGRGFDGPDAVIAATDGLYTDAADRPIAVATADCVPVLMASATQGRVAALHAGWRGVAAGMIERGSELFGDPGGLTVAIGPAAGPCCYEVGPEVVAAISEVAPGGAVVRRDGERIYLDLVGSIRRILEARGVSAVEDTGLCTITERERFFSHRRDGPCGRQLAIAARY